MCYNAHMNKIKEPTVYFVITLGACIVYLFVLGLFASGNRLAS